MFSGSAAIDFLTTEIRKNTLDSEASSHWQHYHSTFNFTGNGFEGLQGFGNCKKPYRGFNLILHRLLQYKFRRIGIEFPQFKIIDQLANDVTASQNRAYDLDVLRQAITLAFLKKQIPNALLPHSVVCVIGDGFASMAALLLASRFAGSIILINLTKTLLVDLWYLRAFLRSAFETAVDLVVDKEGLDNLCNSHRASNSGRVIAIQAVDHTLLQHFPVDLVVNIASMQEMNPQVIEGYFDDLRTIALKRPVYFYCCNREEKSLPDGTTTRFLAYPWHPNDMLLIDELCPWHQHYYSLKPPFYWPYDGAHRHRLTKFL